MIHGIDVILFEMVDTGETDRFDRPVLEPTDGEVIHNVLVSPSMSDEVTNELNLSGKKLVYDLAIPKGDTHNWKDALVVFFNRTWHVVNIPTEGIEDMIPLEWNKKAQVEAYE